MYATVKNTVEFEVFGKYALFTSPISKLSEEKLTYQIPTYSALKGIAEAIYWKPTIQWYIDEVRVMNQIKMVAKGVRIMAKTANESDLVNNTFLVKPHYQVRMHFEFNEHRSDLEEDRNEGKHFSIAKRSIKRGGRRNVFLGTSECTAFVQECEFGQDPGFYDDVDYLNFGLMLHGVDYPDETGQDVVRSRYWEPQMKNGIIRFIRPEECLLTTDVKKASAKHFTLRENVEPVNDLYERLEGTHS